MADTRYLKRRHETWFFSIAVPRDLRAKVGKERIVTSLKTRDLTVAQSRRWAKLLEVQEAFARLSGRKPFASPPLAPEALLEIDEYARAAYHEALAAMDADARKGVRAWDRSELDVGYDHLSNCYVTSNFAPVAEPLAVYCEQKGFVTGSGHYTQLGDALLSARMLAIEGRQKALEHKSSEEPSTFLDYVPVDPVTLRPLGVDARSGRLIFAEVAARFIAEKQRDPAFKLTEQTRGQYEAAFRLFDQWAREPNLDDVNRRKASDFLDAIASLNPHWGRGPGVKKLSFFEIADRFGGHTPGLSAKTINRYAMAMSMVWQYARLAMATRARTRGLARCDPPASGVATAK